MQKADKVWESAFNVDKVWVSALKSEKVLESVSEVEKSIRKFASKSDTTVNCAHHKLNAVSPNFGTYFGQNLIWLFDNRYNC